MPGSLTPFLLVTFHHCDKTPERINLEEKKVIWAHSFTSFGLGQLNPRTLDCDQVKHHSEAHVRTKLPDSWQPRCQIKEREVLESSTAYPTRPHLLRVPPPPNNTRSGDLVFNA